MSFMALQALARSFGAPHAARCDRERLHDIRELGATALPLCLREVAGADDDRRTWAAELLIALSDDESLRPRIIASLRELAAADGDDEAKVSILALLAELGEPTTAATFRDPREIHRRSLGELAQLLTCRPDVALAADLLVSQLDGDALLELVDALARTAPARTRHLVDELLLRPELDAGLRGELVRVAAPLALVESEPLVDPPRRAPRVFLLRHDNGRTVAIVLRKDQDHWRCLCLLVDDTGCLGDAMYREDAAPRAIRDELIDPLLADGFVPEPTRAKTVRSVLAVAARRTIVERRDIPPAYFLGRDLLGLLDDHEPDWRARREPDLPTTLLGRATDLLSTGESERARPLLERCVELAPDDADAAAAFGLCLLGNGDLDGARSQLERAVHLEPSWPLHHWNLAAIAHRQGRLGACYLALRAYARTARASNDPDHVNRLAVAARFIADHERMVRLEHPGADAVHLARKEIRALRAGPRTRAARSATDSARSRTRPRAARRPRR
jgi:tetratricopeptide (TPR) repeat protein